MYLCITGAAIQAFGTDIPKVTMSTNPDVPHINPTAYLNITKPEYEVSFLKPRIKQILSR